MEQRGCDLQHANSIVECRQELELSQPAFQTDLTAFEP